jgi:hypothetical protein
MKNQTCICCGKKKSLLNCGLCDSLVCKYCAHFIDEDRVSFYTQTPEELTHSTYCNPCFIEKISSLLDAYDELMERAKNIMVFNKNQSKETRLIKRLEDPVSVQDCVSDREALLKIAFLSAQAGYNAIIDIVLTPKKIKQGTYQTTKWSATGIPAHVNEDKLIKDRSFSKCPN